MGSEKNHEKPWGDSLVPTLDSRVSFQQATYNALGPIKEQWSLFIETIYWKDTEPWYPPSQIFNPMIWRNQWEILNADDSESPLLNRATQGLYPPGSTLRF